MNGTPVLVFCTQTSNEPNIPMMPSADSAASLEFLKTDFSEYDAACLRMDSGPPGGAVGLAVAEIASGQAGSTVRYRASAPTTAPGRTPRSKVANAPACLTASASR